jgi:hypothetical protein
MERSAIRELKVPGFAEFIIGRVRATRWLHPGYKNDRI